nr:hypothetical protein HmN_000048000 [Hymenolepis microstoma]
MEEQLWIDWKMSHQIRSQQPDNGHDGGTEMIIFAKFNELLSLSLGVSGSATPVTTPNELQSNNESPSFQGLQSTLQAGHHGVQQNMENIDSNTTLLIPVIADSQSPSTSSMATVDTIQTSPHQRPNRDKRSRPKSGRSQPQESKPQRASLCDEHYDYRTFPNSLFKLLSFEICF